MKELKKGGDISHTTHPHGSVAEVDMSIFLLNNITKSDEEVHLSITKFKQMETRDHCHFETKTSHLIICLQIRFLKISCNSNVILDLQLI